MALSRRLFLGGLLAAAAAPAIVTSKGFKPAVGRGLTSAIQHIDEAGWHYYGTVTGRMSSSEPAWQELPRNLTPEQREAVKRITFGARYGTQWEPGNYEQARARRERFGSPLAKVDFSDLELRMIAERNYRDLFNGLKSR